MPVTEQAKRHKQKKVLTKRLKEQKRNAAKVEKRISKIEKELFQLEIDSLIETKWLSQLTWKYTGYMGHFEAFAIHSVESMEDNEIAKKIIKWIWQYDKDKGYVVLKKTGSKLIAISLDLNTSNNSTIAIFAVDFDTWAKEGEDKAKKMLDAFIKKFGMEVNFNESE